MFAVSLIFSQRAIIFVYAMEMIYAQYVFSTIRLKYLLRLFAVVGPALLMIAVLRGRASGFDFTEGLLLGLESVVRSRYFFDIARSGAVYIWQDIGGGIDFLALNFLLEPIIGSSVIYFKEVGSIAAYEIWGYEMSGVTLGIVMEFIVSFGAVLSALLLLPFFFAFFRAESSMLTSNSFFFIKLLFVGKILIALNSSLGSFTYQTLLEFVFFMMLAGFITTRQGATGKPDIRAGRMPGPFRPNVAVARPR
jgi:hypothetical protein